MRTTHTLAQIELSPQAYDEIEALFRNAGYDHVFLEDGMIDMTGIGIIVAQSAEVVKPDFDVTLENHSGAPHFM